MKKLMIAVAVAMLAVASAKAEFFWSTWDADSVKGKSVSGCVLGLSSDIDTISGAQIDICVSKANLVKAGCQYAIGYSRAVELHNGVQIALFNRAKSASLQLGLLCFNETGFLPFFVFFNFDGSMFGK